MSAAGGVAGVLPTARLEERGKEGVLRNSSDTQASPVSTTAGAILSINAAERKTHVAEQARPSFVFRTDITDISHTGVKKDVGIVTKYMKANPGHGLTAFFQEELEKYQYGLTIKNKSISRCAQPTRQWIECRASHYKQKYGIEILMTNICDLEKFLPDFIRANQNSNQYKGVIVQLKEDEPQRLSHCAPLLFYFGPNGTECLVADAGGLDSDNFVLLDWGLSLYLGKLGIDTSHIFYATEARIADTYSCRLEALLFLRNALLYFTLQQEKLPFDKCFHQVQEKREGGILLRKIVPFLPPEWSHHAHIRSKLPNADQAKVVIDHFNPKKKHNPRTIAEFVKHYTEDNRFEAHLGVCYKSNHLSDKECTALVERARQKGLKVDDKEVYGSFITFEMTLPVCGFLYRKAMKEAAKTQPQMANGT